MEDFNPDAYLASAQSTSPQAPQAPTQDTAGFDPDEYLKDAREEHYGTPGQMIGAAVEGAAKGLLGPVATQLERSGFHIPAEDIRGREEANPITAGVGQAVGLGAGLLTDTGEAAAMTRAGKMAAAAAGLGKVAEGASLAARVGSEAVKQAAEMAVMSSGDEVSKVILHDPNLTAETAISNIGLGTALGGAGGAFMAGAINPLWKATVGPALESTLGSLRARLNGDTTSALADEVKSLGLSMPSEIEGAMSDNPMLRNAASGLRQTDTSRIARGFQETENQFRDQVVNKMGEAFGHTPESVESLDVSKAAAGKSVGDELVREYSEKIDPIIKDLNSAKEKFVDAELNPDKVNRFQDNSDPFHPKVVEQVTPGSSALLRDKVLQKAGEEGWLADPISPEARMVKTLMKQIKGADSLGELVKIGQNLGNSTKSTLPFGMQTPLSRAGSIVRDILRNEENNIILGKLGKDAPEELLKYRAALQNFKGVAEVRDVLNDRLKVNGSVSGFAKGLKEMANSDSEKLLSRLKGTNDAHIIGYLQENMPGTAEKLKQYHLDELLAKSTKDGKLVPTKLISNINKLSPEMREFVIGADRVHKVEQLNGFLTKLNDVNHNFSNTARTVDKVLSTGAASATGLIAALTGHAGIGVAVPIAEMLGKEGTSGARLAMLRFLGSDQAINAPAFKSMVDFLHNTYKGENTLAKASAAVFKASSQVLADHLHPDNRDRTKLDKQVSDLTDHPDKVSAMGDSQLGHYLPEHQQAVVATSVRALQYLQQLKPKPVSTSPLDKPIEPSPAQMARYHRALDIASQPAVILEHIKDGTLQQSDMADLNGMYPGLYKSMVAKLSDNMINIKNEEHPIPYRTRVSLSLFMGQALDSTMTPQSIMAAQPKPQPPPQQQAAQSKGGGAPSRLKEKGAKAYMTPTQQAESDRSNRS